MLHTLNIIDQPNYDTNTSLQQYFAVLIISFVPIVLLYNWQILSNYFLVNFSALHATHDGQSSVENIFLLVVIILIIICVLFSVLDNSKNMISLSDEVIADQALLQLVKDKSVLLDQRVAKVEYKLSDKSFTENKKTIYLNVRSKCGKQHNYDTLMSVNLHELAHVFSKSFDANHISAEFHTNHQKLIDKAIELKIYNPHHVYAYDSNISCHND